MIDGCEYREAVQAVRVEGGSAGNVVPDLATVTVNHRFAPDRTPEEAEAHLRELLAPFLEDGDDAVVVDMANGSPPAVDHPLLAARRAEPTCRWRPSSAGPTSPASPRTASPPPTSAPATPRWPTPPTSGSTGRIDRCFEALADLLRHGDRSATATP